MSRITSALPSNRVASLATFIAGLAGLGTSLAGVWPNSTTNEIAQILGGAGALAGPLSHVVGSWLWDRTPAGQTAARAKLFSNPAVAAAAEQAAKSAEILSNLSTTSTGSDTELPPDLKSDTEPWFKWWDDPQTSESIENEQFDDSTPDPDDGSNQTDDLTSSELGGPPNTDYAPESALTPEPETKQEQKRIVTDSPQA